jgi:hypothetical protein
MAELKATFPRGWGNSCVPTGPWKRLSDRRLPPLSHDVFGPCSAVLRPFCACPDERQSAIAATTAGGQRLAAQGYPCNDILSEGLMRPP